MDVTEKTEDIKPVDSARKLSGQLAVSPVGGVLPANMGEVKELAQYMSKTAAMLPAHLRDNPAMCMGVIMDAIAWRMNPFRLATQHMVVNGVGSYMSQAITGIINQNAVIQGRLVPEYEGEGEALICKLAPLSTQGQVLPYESPRLKDITPRNSPLWKTDVRQQLFYYSARAWCRRYFPELLMGVYDPDEARTMKDITPAAPVENFLNDEPDIRLRQETSPSAGEEFAGVKTKITILDEAANFTEEQSRAMFNQPNVVDETDPVDESGLSDVLKAKQLFDIIAGHTDAVLLQQWQHDNHGRINDLPPDILKRVRKALADKLFELEAT